MKRRTIDRRRFLKLGATAAAGFSLPLRRMPASERIGIGIIGVGSLGGSGHHLGRMLGRDDCDVVALADVDRDHLEQAVAKTDGRAQGYADYRALLDRRDVDAVIIVTPDHWHALQAVHACAAGKDVYCEKPLSLTVADGRAMAGAARRWGTVFQTGTQQRSDARFRHACELVRNGRLGKLQSVHVVLGEGPTSEWQADAAPPAHLDWDAWLGPAPWVPYNEKRCHYTFRWFYDYSGGKLTDWGAHHLDIVQWALGTEQSGPVAVEARGVWPVTNFFETAVDFEVDYAYANGVTVHATGKGENGITFQGADGEVFVSRSAIHARPQEILDTPVGGDRIVLEASNDHHGNWLSCIRSRRRPISDVEVGHRSASVCHIGNIAMLLGRPLRWDPAAERFEGDEAANRMLRKPTRGAWTL